MYCNLNMKNTYFLIFIATFFWGLWGFFGKLAANKIGVQASFWNGITLALVIIIYLLLTNQLLPIKSSSSGILFALSAGIASGLASVVFYILLEKSPAGYLVTLTALYPLVTIILSVIFLHESLSSTRIIGFIFALIALFFLNL